MDVVLQAVGQFSLFLLPHLKVCTVAMISTVLVIYGDTINKYIKTNIRSMNFILRVLVFVMICTFAYGGMLAFVAPLLAKLLAKLSIYYLSPVIVSIFFLIGLLAERRKYI